MNQKPEALRLAELLDAYHTARHHKEAAAELRRLAAVEAQRDALLEALRAMRVKYGQYACRVCDLADAAIKAVEENT